MITPIIIFAAYHGSNVLSKIELGMLEKINLRKINSDIQTATPFFEIAKFNNYYYGKIIEVQGDKERIKAFIKETILDRDTIEKKLYSKSIVNEFPSSPPAEDKEKALQLYSQFVEAYSEVFLELQLNKMAMLTEQGAPEGHAVGAQEVQQTNTPALRCIFFGDVNLYHQGEREALGFYKDEAPQSNTVTGYLVNRTDTQKNQSMILFELNPLKTAGATPPILEPHNGKPVMSMAILPRSAANAAVLRLKKHYSVPEEIINERVKNGITLLINKDDEINKLYTSGIVQPWGKGFSAIAGLPETPASRRSSLSDSSPSVSSNDKRSYVGYSPKNWPGSPSSIMLPPYSPNTPGDSFKKKEKESVAASSNLSSFPLLDDIASAIRPLLTSDSVLSSLSNNIGSSSSSIPEKSESSPSTPESKPVSKQGSPGRIGLFVSIYKDELTDHEENLLSAIQMIILHAKQQEGLSGFIENLKDIMVQADKPFKIKFKEACDLINTSPVDNMDTNIIIHEIKDILNVKPNQAVSMYLKIQNFKDKYPLPPINQLDY